MGLPIGKQPDRPVPPQKILRQRSGNCNRILLSGIGQLVFVLLQAKPVGNLTHLDGLGGRVLIDIRRDMTEDSHVSHNPDIS